MKLFTSFFLFLFFISVFTSCDLERRLANEQEKVEFSVEEGEKREERKKKKDPLTGHTEKTEKEEKKEAPSKELGFFKEKYAAQMGVKPDELINGRLYQYIDGWIGVPYKYAGNTREGVDCSGFVNAVFRDVYGVALKRSALDIVNQVGLINKEKLTEGDLVFFDISGKNSHIGIYLVNNKFIHASSSKGVIISDLTQAYYTKYWGRAGRVKRD